MGQGSAGEINVSSAQAQAKGLTSDGHFTVDGTLVEAWASLKSFQSKDQKKGPPDDPGNPTVNFHGEKRGNDTHESTTDADAVGAELKLSSPKAVATTGQFPADQELDISNTEFSPGVRRMQALVGQDASFDHGRGLRPAAHTGGGC